MTSLFVRPCGFQWQTRNVSLTLIWAGWSFFFFFLRMVFRLVGGSTDEL